MKIRSAAALVLALGLAACASDDPKHLNIRSAMIVESGLREATPEQAEQCKEFKPGNEEALALLREFEVISAEERDQQFTRSPCYVRGIAAVGGRPVHWEIQSAGLAYVIRDDDSVLWLGDDGERND